MIQAGIQNGWHKTTLGEVAEYINRGITPSYSDSGVFVINQKCIRGGSVSYKESRLTDPTKKKILSEKYVKNGDILICSTGTGTLGRVGQIKNIKNDTTADSHVTIVRPGKSVDVDYLGFLLKKSEREIELMAEGSTGQTELPRAKLSNFQILLPPLSEQGLIAAILSALDSKINLLHEQSKTLETIAQKLFYEWFIEFNFIDEGRPYKKGGGKMVESELGV